MTENLLSGAPVHRELEVLSIDTAPRLDGVSRMAPRAVSWTPSWWSGTESGLEWGLE
jgi:hypothetical protein